MTELDDSERTPEEMLREVKVAYRVVEIYGPPDVDAIPYDAERTAAIDAEFDHWLAEVKREAVAEALLKNVTGRRKLADACLVCGKPLERLDANTICRRCWFHGNDSPAREVAPALEIASGGVTPDFGIVGAQIGAQRRKRETDANAD